MLHGTSLDADELLGVGAFTWQGPRGETLPLVLVAARPGTRGVLVRFAGHDDRDGAARLTGGHLLAETARLPDPGPGVAYTFQLVGLEVRDESGRLLGVLEDILATGAHPVYVVRGERELLVPAHPDVVRQVDLEGRRITVALPAGLEDL